MMSGQKRHGIQIETSTVVVDAQFVMIASIGQGDVDPRALGMAQCVGNCFLDEAKGGKFSLAVESGPVDVGYQANRGSARSRSAGCHFGNRPGKTEFSEYARSQSESDVLQPVKALGQNPPCALQTRCGFGVGEVVLAGRVDQKHDRCDAGTSLVVQI